MVPAKIINERCHGVTLNELPDTNPPTNGTKKVGHFYNRNFHGNKMTAFMNNNYGKQ